MKLAALDLGSNSFLCLICDWSEGSALTITKDLLRVVRLGEGLSQSGLFQDSALQRADQALSFFAEEIKKEKCDHVLAFATAAARDARNKEDFFQICRTHGIPVEIVSGLQEAETTFQGALCEVQGQPGLEIQDHAFQLVIDIGGRSTEFVLGHQKRVLFSCSLNMGCVGMKEKWIDQFPVGSERAAQIQIDVQSILSSTLQKILQELQQVPLEIIAVAGTPTTLATMDLGLYDPQQIEGYRLSQQKLAKWCLDLSAQTPDEIQKKYHIDPKRADVIYIGAEILNQIMHGFSKKAHEMKVSTKGIRYGAMMELVKRLER